MEDTGRTSGGFEVPEGSSYALSFPHVDTAESPNPNTLTPPAESGLSGASMATPAGSPDMGNPQPVQPAPHPAETAARGVFAALSGAGGHPMDWARATIAGGLAAAANVGQVAPGQGFLAGAAKGAQAVQQRQDQQQAIAAKQKQQDFENAEKQKADERAQQELQNSTDRTKAEVGLTTAQTLASIQTRQQNAAQFPTLQKEKQLQVTDLENKIQDSEKEGLALLSSAGVDIMKLQHVTKTDQLTASDAHQAGSGSVFPAGNGEAHSGDEDNFGAYVVPQSVWGQRMPSDGTITVSAGIDKDGKPITKQQPYSAGTTLGTLWAVIRGSQKNYEDQENQIVANAKKQQEVAKGAGAATDEKLKQGLTQSEIDKNEAEAKAAGTKNEAKGDQPVYAYNTQTKQQEQTTKNEMAAHPGVYINPVEIKEGDIRKDVDLVRQLGDAQMNISRYRTASQNFNQALDKSDRSRIASLLGEDKIKVGLLGSELPTDWAQKLYNSDQWDHLSPQAKDAVIGYIGSRGAVIAYQKAVSGSGRSNKEQLELELQNIPSPLEPDDIREKKFDRFQQNIDQTGAGLPKMVGIERPSEIKTRIEKEAAANKGATHVYDADTGSAIPVGAEPVKNIFGSVIGYKDANGQVVRTKR